MDRETVPLDFYRVTVSQFRAEARDLSRALPNTSTRS